MSKGFSLGSLVAVVVAVVSMVATIRVADAQVYTTTPNLPIPDATANGRSEGIVSTLEISGAPNVVRSMRVTINLTHTYVSDLVIYLFPPGVNPPENWNDQRIAEADAAGGIRLFMQQGGFSQNMVNTVFTTAADPFGAGAQPIANGVGPFTGTWLPEIPGQFGAVYGNSGNGTWRLAICDTFDLDTGVLQNWSIEFGATPPAGPTQYLTRVRQGEAAIGIDYTNPQDTIDPLFVGQNNTITYRLTNTGSTNAITVNTITVANQNNCTVTVATGTPIVCNTNSTISLSVNVNPTALGPLSFNLTLDTTATDVTIRVSSWGGHGSSVIVDSAGGAGVDFQDLGAAFDSLETNGIAQNCTVTVRGGPFTSAANYSLDEVPGNRIRTLNIVAANGTRPVIQGANASSNWGISTSAVGFDGNSNVTFQGFELNGQGGAIGVAITATDPTRPSTRVSIRNCRIYNFVNAGIAAFDFYLTLTNVRDTRLENNVVYNIDAVNDAANFGIRGALFFGRAARAVAIHNTIAHSHATADQEAIYIEHNFNANPPQQPVPIERAMASFSNNIIIATRGLAALGLFGTPPIAANGNLWHLGPNTPFGAFAPTTFNDWRALGKDIAGQLIDPQIQDLGAFDLRLRINSPAINASIGSNLATDYDQVSRSGVPDIGAYEFNATIQEIAIHDPSGANITRTTTVNLGNLGTGVGMDFTFTIYNTTGANLLLGVNPVSTNTLVNCAVAITQPGALALAGGESTTFTLRVTATALGAVSFNVSVNNNDPGEAPFTFSINATGVNPAPEIDIQRPVGTSIPDGTVDDLGNRQVGIAIDLVFTLANIGSATLNVTTPIGLQNATNCTATTQAEPASAVPLQSTTTFTVRVTPSALGQFFVDLVITNTDANENPYNIRIQGTAANLGFISVPTSVAFVVNDQQTLTLTNSGSGPLTITALQVNDPNNFWFQSPATPSFPIVLSPGAQFVLTYIYAPGTPQAATADVYIISDTGGVPGSVTQVQFNGSLNPVQPGSGLVVGGSGCASAPNASGGVPAGLLLGLLVLTVVRRRRHQFVA